ncbi:MAG: hypothetical protein F4129_03845 [Acidimicrobiia bacterium]|nr:hypothetical protein [Acidimicrobiia bacterium]
MPVTIVDNDPPMLSLSGGGPVAEGAPAAFTIVATSPPANDLTVRYRVRQNDPFVIFPGDFVAEANLGFKTVVLPAGDLSADFEVATMGDEPSQAEAGGDGQACGSADALAAKARANHDALANTAANRKERNDWWRAWIALSGKTGTYNTPLTAAEARLLETGDARWTPFRQALECTENNQS